MSPTKSNTNVLAERSPNTGSPTKAGIDINGKPTSLLTKQAPSVATSAPAPRFELNMGKEPSLSSSTSTSSTYISPSDAIRSPTTKKLSEIKGKRYQNAKPSNLFAKTMAMERFKAHEKQQQQQQLKKQTELEQAE
ncbi:hypothetical protein B0A52_08289 [Exophiala mesophila]|uniref:Uncharacterized protein n=1 Tax=Exophiala mesophila TaxID=212818 RepID=A0A438MWL5_EXOME|nr:hypothetical protein B0A52_08289 [Exophiala mesophila]